MLAEQYITFTNRLYASSYDDYAFSTEVNPIYANFLENIPKVHELAHALSGTYGGPDNNYVFSEYIAIPIEFGLIGPLGLADRHIDSFFIRPKRRGLSDLSFRSVFVNAATRPKRRYPAAQILEVADMPTQRLYAHIAVDLLNSGTSVLIDGLIEIGNGMGELLKEQKKMQVRPLILDKDDDLTFYPWADDIENSNILASNEGELRRVLETTSVVELYEMFKSASSIRPDVIKELVKQQAIFLHIVFGHTPEFCATQLNLEEGFPEEYVIWRRDRNNEIYFDRVQASNLLTQHYPPSEYLNQLCKEGTI